MTDAMHEQEDGTAHIDIPWYRPIETWVALDGDRKIVGGPASSAAAAQRNAARRGIVPQRTITWTEFKQEPVA